MNSIEEKKMAFERLLKIMDELREQCPWDKKQTMESLAYLTIEEVYELNDAIHEGNSNDIKKEIGDLMLHMVFYARIASENNSFDIADVIHAQCEKLIHRHPHIYGSAENGGEKITVADEEEVKRNWEKLKLKEGNASVLSGVPKSLPAIVKAMRIQEKARGAGFDWEKPEQVWQKVEEEMNELKVEIEKNNPSKIENEFGDVFFSLINYARFAGINPEKALEQTNKKFIKRFQYLETESAKEGKSLSDMTLDEMDVYWNRAKSFT